MHWGCPRSTEPPTRPFSQRTHPTGRDQNFPQLDSSMRLDHDELVPLQGGLAPWQTANFPMWPITP